MIESPYFQFCSVVEAEHRQKVHDVHTLESTLETRDLRPSQRMMDPTLAVKKFYRTGSLSHDSSHRSFEALDITVHYLIFNIWNSDSLIYIQNIDPFNLAFNFNSLPLPHLFIPQSIIDDFGMRYGFVMNRMNAVRQEIVIHTPELLGTIGNGQQNTYDIFKVINLLVIIIRFYIQVEFIVSKISCHLSHTLLLRLHRNKEKEKNPILSWFDNELHKSSTTSCISTAIHGCRMYLVSMSKHKHSRQTPSSSVSNSLQVPVTQLELHCLTLLDELNSYVILINQSEHIIAAVKQCQSVKIFNATTSTISLINNLTMHSSTTFIDSLKDMANYNEKAEDIFKYSKIVTALVCQIRQGNPAGISTFFKHLVTCCLQSQSQSQHSSHLLQRPPTQHIILSLMAILSSMVPELRIWRLIYANKTANKAEVVSKASMNGRIWVDSQHEIITRLICELLGIPMHSSSAVDSYILKQQSQGQSSVPVEDIANALKFRSLFSLAGQFYASEEGEVTALPSSKEDFISCALKLLHTAALRDWIIDRDITSKYLTCFV